MISRIIVVVSVLINVMTLCAYEWLSPEYNLESISKRNLPMPCCYPVQFEATLGPQGGFPAETVPGVFHTDILLSYDLPGKRWGYRVRQTHVTGDYKDMFMIEDYKKGTQTVWFNGECTTIPLNTTYQMKNPACVPRRARYRGILRQGWKNKRSIHHISWSWQLDKNWMFFVTLLKHKCIPILETAFTEEPNVVTNIEFYDFKTGLSQVPIFEQFSQSDCTSAHKHMGRFDSPVSPQHLHFRKRFTSKPGDPEPEGVAKIVIGDD